MSQQPTARRAILLWIALAVTSTSLSYAQKTEFTEIAIDNTSPRKDEQGNIIDAHEGSLRFFNDKYYLYGTQYGETDGKGNTNRLVVYTSADLVHWRNEGPILHNEPPAWYDRPHVVYNASTGKYILWHLYMAGGNYNFGVAQADDPLGPFVIISNDVKLVSKGAAGGDFSILVDDDGKAYILYTTEGATRVTRETFRATTPPSGPITYFQTYIDALTPDYLGSAGVSTSPWAGNVEANVIFKRGDLYYVLFDNTCYWCSAGTGVRVYTSRHPLGPFEYRGNINRLGQPSRGSASPWTPPGTGRPDATIKAQQADVSVIPSPNGGKTYLWIGDRFHWSPDGIKGHDGQNWAVLSFGKDGMIEPLENRDFWLVPVPSH